MQTPRILTIEPTHLRPHTTVAVGRLSPAEESALRRQLPESAEWLRTAELEQALAPIAAKRVDRVVLLQSRPDELPCDLPQRVKTANSDVELLSLAGAWCEGELRTGNPWEAVQRCYWHQFGSQDEPSDEDQRPLVLVNASLLDNASAWIDALDELGYGAVWAKRDAAEPLASAADLAIWDGAMLDGREASQLASFCQQRRACDTPVIAVFDFPRADAVQSALRVGAAAVLGRPWTLEQAQSTIVSVLQTAGETHRALPAAALSRAA